MNRLLVSAGACLLFATMVVALEMDGFLKAHGVFLDLTLEDVQKDTDAALASSR